MRFILAMFQSSRRGILLAASFYKNFVIRKEDQSSVDFEEVGLSQQKVFCSKVSSIFIIRKDLSLVLFP